MSRSVPLVLSGLALILIGCGESHRFSDASFRPDDLPASAVIEGVTMRLQKVNLNSWSMTAWVEIENQSTKPFALNPAVPLEIELCGFKTIPDISIDDGTNKYKTRYRKPSPLVIPPQGTVKLKLYVRNSSSSFGPAYTYTNHEDWGILAHPDPARKLDDLLILAKGIKTTTPVVP